MHQDLKEDEAMKRIVFVVAVMLLIGCHSHDCYSQGVDFDDVKSYGNGVEVLGVAGIENYPDVGAVLQSVPLDDSGKWHLALFTQSGCSACERLKRDLQEDPLLKAISDWCHFNVYSTSSRSQRFRFQRFKISGYPTLVLYPPQGSNVFPFQTVDRMTGYDGDAKGLVKRLLAKIRAFVKRFFRGPPDDRYRPTPPPYRPDLSPYIPDLSPLIPDVPDLAPDDAPNASEYAEYPEVILIIDPEGLGEKLKAKAAEKMIERLREKYDLQLKIRTVKWEDSIEQYPFVRRSDTPAIVVTRDKRLVGFLSIGVMSAMRGEHSATDGLVTTGTAASGWIVLAVAGGVLLLRGMARRRKQAGNGEESALHRFRPSVFLGRAVERVRESRAQAAASEMGAKRSAEDLSAEIKTEAAAVDQLKKSLDGK